MNELANRIARMTGLSKDQARIVAAEVLRYLQRELPEPLADEIDLIIDEDHFASREARSLGLFRIP